jgi:hypothetical protein
MDQGTATSVEFKLEGVDDIEDEIGHSWASM